MDDFIYLDYAATTPVDPRVQEAMAPYFGRHFGNPSSVHRAGQLAEAALEESRRTMAEVLGCAPDEIVFTGCGSESDNLALRGAALAGRRRHGANHILVSPVEHDAVLSTGEALAEHHGFELQLLPVDPYGRVAPDELEAALRDETAVVSVIYANNEIGTINPIAELAEVCRRRGIPFHTDAIQAGSQLSLSVEDLGIDMLSLGAHKLYGPKGTGALYVRSGVELVPTLTGGSHERGRRAGTSNVPLVVGMAQALHLTERERAGHNARFERLRSRLVSGLSEKISGARLTGHPADRLPNHASFVFPGIDGNELVAALDIAGYGCSSGSACKTGDPEPSSVLKAIGCSDEEALGSLRVTVGRPTTDAEIDKILADLPTIVERLREPTRAVG